MGARVPIAGPLPHCQCKSAPHVVESAEADEQEGNMTKSTWAVAGGVWNLWSCCSRSLLMGAMLVATQQDRS